MAAAISEAQSLLLCGKTLDEALRFLNERAVNYQLVFTRDERTQEEVEERVIRILPKEEHLEILVG
ncbi:MAG: hypothetical protein RBT41_06045, partial [Clostridia bacterium]|nr:hypothetical protein [Clostridia bacterium]